MALTRCVFLAYMGMIVKKSQEQFKKKRKIKMKDRLFYGLLLLCVLMLAAGCSFSYSSGASSDSSKSSSASSGGSEASPEEAIQTYKTDVSAYTSSVAREGNAEDYMRELGSIAEKHGITDWERNTATYNAIGTGLRRAGIKSDEIRNVYFMPDLIAREKNALVLVQESYQP